MFLFWQVAVIVTQDFNKAHLKVVDCTHGDNQAHDNKSCQNRKLISFLKMKWRK